MNFKSLIPKYFQKGASEDSPNNTVERGFSSDLLDRHPYACATCETGTAFYLRKFTDGVSYQVCMTCAQNPDQSEALVSLNGGNDFTDTPLHNISSTGN